jgi:hypothetical protein
MEKVWDVEYYVEYAGMPPMYETTTFYGTLDEVEDFAAELEANGYLDVAYD